MISREVEVASYKDVCGGEKRKVNIGYYNHKDIIKVENNELQEYPKGLSHKRHLSSSYIWEIFTKFFSIHNIEPNWLNCNFTWGWYDEDLGGWTGCMGKV